MKTPKQNTPMIMLDESSGAYIEGNEAIIMFDIIIPLEEKP